MINRAKRALLFVQRLALWAVSLTFLYIATNFIYLSILNSFFPSTEYLHPEIINVQERDPGSGLPVFHVGDLIRIDYDIKRHKLNGTCRLRIQRMAETVGGRFHGREHTLEYNEQNFIGDDVTRPSGYWARLDLELIDDPEVDEQQFDIYSRVQFLCNWVDYWSPRFLMTNGRRGTERVRIILRRHKS